MRLSLRDRHVRLLRLYRGRRLRQSAMLLSSSTRACSSRGLRSAPKPKRHLLKVREALRHSALMTSRCGDATQRYGSALQA